MPRARKCQECDACDRNEPATSIIVWRGYSGRLQSRHVCADHAEMVLEDLELEGVINHKETIIMPRNKEEAAALVPLMPWNLLEIAQGRRHGKPTLVKSDPLSRAAGMLSGKPVEWRD